MKENFNTIKKAFANAGIDVKTVEYKITPYSLNTDLSFKFNDAEELLEFLNLTAPEDNNKIEKIHKSLVDEAIDTKDFFYVNFYKPKIAEL